MNRHLIAITIVLSGLPLLSRSSQAQPAKPPATKPAGAGGDVKPIPPPGNEISPADRAELSAGVEALGKEVDALRSELKDKPALLARLPDVVIYHNAVRYPLQYNELLDVAKARTSLKSGTERAAQLRAGQTPWVNASGLRGYESQIDGSVQPYVLAVPSDRGGPVDAKGARKHRLEVFCHGRDEKLTELNFISGKQGNAPAAGEKFVLSLYGRYCNANKFAGEIDCLEAMADVKARYPIDENRVLMIGFSMGGAAAWQFAVHYTDLWAAASPGAGFSESKEFLKLAQSGELEQVPWYEKTLWHWYDCTDYAANLYNLPTIAYAGEIDPQKQASDAMIKPLEAEGLKLDRIIGPKTAHSYEKGAKAELDKRLDEILAKGRNPVPPKVRFTTWTLRYNRMYWLSIEGMDQHWRRARADAQIDGDSIKASVENVNRLGVWFKPGECPFKPGTRPAIVLGDAKGEQKVDGPPVEAGEPWSVHLVRDGDRWRVAAQSDYLGLRKSPGLQGPIDDAFLSAFLIVTPTGKPLNDKAGQWVAAECEHAISHWRKQFRGEPRVKSWDKVTPDDMARYNLVLFGDPSSNRVMADLLGKDVAATGIKWTADQIAVGDQTFPADHHVPVLIFPNPVHPDRYVVINSGFTFREFDYLNNARQTPKLPDWAVIDVNTPVTPRGPGNVAAAGFFDEHWRLTPPEQRPGDGSK